jgi:hypothetical protein
LKDVTVKVIGSSTYEGKSDDSGDVTINSIPLGTYLVSYSLSGKAPIYTRLTLKATTKVENMILMTWAECKSGYLATFIDETKCNLMGKVVAADGATLLADATVSVSPAPDKLSYLDTSTAPLSISDTATKTDDSGTFFAKMLPGKYTFTVSHAGHTFDAIEVTINEPCFFKNFTVTAK